MGEMTSLIWPRFCKPLIKELKFYRLRGKTLLEKHFMDDFNLSIPPLIQVITKLFLEFLQYFKGRKSCGKKMFGKLIVAIEILRLSHLFCLAAILFLSLWKHLLSTAFNFIKKFFHFFKQIKTSTRFCTFYLSLLFTFFLSCSNKLQDFCTIKCISRKF